MSPGKFAVVLRAMACGGGAVQAQDKCLSRNIRMLAPFGAGSQTEILARWSGEKTLESWGQQVVVDSRPSADGTIASQYVSTPIATAIP